MSIKEVVNNIPVLKSRDLGILKSRVRRKAGKSACLGYAYMVTDFEGFSEADIPRFRSLEKKVNKRSNLPESDVDVGPILDIYNDIFSFDRKGKKGKGEFRPQQIQYMLSCYEAAENGIDIVIEGPTGLGKTRALIASALPHLLKNPKARLLYTTRTVTQVQNVTEELEKILKREGSPFSEIDATLYTGVNKIKQSICKEVDKDNSEDCRDCPVSDTKRVPAFEYNSQVLDSDCLKDIRKKGACPIPFFRERAKDSRIIVAPFNYLFDSEWKEKVLGKNLEDVILIVDEAHNFLDEVSNTPVLNLLYGSSSETKQIDHENRISNTYCLEDILVKGIYNSLIESNNPEIEGIPCANLFSYLKLIGEEFYQNVRALCNDENKILNGNNGNGFAEKYLLSEHEMMYLKENLGNGFLDNLKKTKNLLKRLRKNPGKKYSKLFVPAFEKTPPLKPYEKLGPTIASYIQILEPLIEALETPYAFQLTVEDKKLSLYSLHPKEKAKAAIKGFHSKIFTSATLSPPEDVSFLLGLEDSLNIKIDPVFKDENYCPFFIAGVNSSNKDEFKDTGKTYTKNEQEIINSLFYNAFNAAQGKNIGVFCNNNRTVQELSEYASKLKKSLDLLVLSYTSESQVKENGKIVKKKFEVNDDYKQACEILGMNDIKNNPTADNYIEVFKKLGEIDKTSLLLGVQGGSLSEGIDYRGNQMEMIIAMGLPYPSSAAERKINDTKTAYFCTLLGDKEKGEELSYKQNAFRKLAQSIGRTHRCLTDRAVVICVDERLLGLKNHSDKGKDRYEYLSLRNARNHFNLLQRPMSNLNESLVFLGKNKKEEKILQEYILSGFRNISKKDFICFEKMGEKIKEFYENG
jgi:Rad3-related DNA helicase